MSNRAFGSVVGAAVVCAASSLALAQAVTLKTGLEDGREMAFEIVQSLAVEQRAQPDAEPATYTTDIKALLELHVDSIDASGNGRVSASIAGYEARHEDPDGATSVKYDLANPAKDGVGIASLEPILADATMTFAVDANGGVSAIGGLDDYYNALAGLDDVPRELFRFFEGPVLRDTLSKLFAADGGIGAKNKGDSWTTSRRVPIGSGGAIEVTTESALQIVEGEFAAIAGRATLELYVPREPGPEAPSVTLGESQGQTLCQWDTKAGGLISYSSTERIATEWSLGDRRLLQLQRSRSRIARK